MKSVNIWNLSSSDILLGVTPSELSVVSGGGSVEADLGVVKGAKEVGGSLVRRRFGRGENFLGNDGRRGLNLFFNGFLLSTSLRSVSSMLLSPNLVSSSSSVRSL